MIRTTLRRGLVELRSYWQPKPDMGPVTVLCHCHYPELVPPLIRALRRLPGDAAIHVSSSRAEVFDRWTALRRRLPAPTRFHLVENRGRDIRPFFELARSVPLEPDTLVLKLHGKQSAYSPHGTNWRRDLLSGLLPPDRRALGRIAERFRAQSRLGILGAPRSFISHPVYWGENRETVTRIMREATGREPDEADLGFFAGSMFWIRGSLLQRLLPHVDIEAFEPEPLRQDGTYAHAIERIVPMMARHLGWAVGEVGHDRMLDPDTVRERKIAYL